MSQANFIRKRSTRMVALLSVFALVAAACGSDAATSEEADSTSEVTEAPAAEDSPAITEAPAVTEAPADDEADEGDGTPQRIVSLSATATEMLFAIGAGDRVVAADSYSNYPAEAPTTDLSGFEPSLEAIISYEPDLVVISFDPGEIVSGLEAAGVETIVHPAAATLDDTYTQIADLGIVTGQIEEAAALNAEIREGLDAVVASVPANDGDPIRLYHELDSTFYSASSSSFIGQIYSMLGVENIADEADVDGYGFPQLTPEYIIEANPAVIVITDQGGYTAEDVVARPGWDVLDAANGGSIVTVEADIASRWGPRIVEFAQTIANQLVFEPVG